MVRRWKSDYVLARRVNGELVEANFELSSNRKELKDLSLAPKMTAHIKVKNTNALCLLTNIAHVVKEKQSGCIISLHEKGGHEFGFIKPVDESRDCFFSQKVSILRSVEFIHVFDNLDILDILDIVSIFLTLSTVLIFSAISIF